jgi:hypothetical protein
MFEKPEPVALAQYTAQACPSGLRSQTQDLMEQSSWVRTPLLVFELYGSLGFWNLVLGGLQTFSNRNIAPRPAKPSLKLQNIIIIVERSKPNSSPIS